MRPLQTHRDHGLRANKDHPAPHNHVGACGRHTVERVGYSGRIAGVIASVIAAMILFLMIAQ